MELKHSLELIHICAQHASPESRRRAIAGFLRDHPGIDRDEALAIAGEAEIS